MVCWQQCKHSVVAKQKTRKFEGEENPETLPFLKNKEVCNNLEVK